jgi:hypothetical protein
MTCREVRGLLVAVNIVNTTGRAGRLRTGAGATGGLGTVFARINGFFNKYNFMAKHNKLL